MTKRQNVFCVISKETYGEHGLHAIQTNSGWGANPYGDEYAVVPSYMVDAILETGGYCDVTYTEDGKEVASFVAREKPEPEPIPEPAEPETPADGDLAERVAAVETDLADLTAAVEKGLNL
ncbi:MAG: hypothetical protein IKT30_00580 [Bacteroidaceae bacterium]|nr:hypothetical protein [Bacteroidaceae bacterium]